MPQYTGMFTLSVRQSQAVKNWDNWNRYASPQNVEYWLVAGGGGRGAAYGGGGGGGGQPAGFAGVTPGTSYFVTVGGAGSAALSSVGGNGGASVFDAVELLERWTYYCYWRWGRRLYAITLMRLPEVLVAVAVDMVWYPEHLE